MTFKNEVDKMMDRGEMGKIGKILIIVNFSVVNTKSRNVDRLVLHTF